MYKVMETDITEVNRPSPLHSRRWKEFYCTLPAKKNITEVTTIKNIDFIARKWLNQVLKKERDSRNYPLSKLPFSA
jgi:hypothetical protein